MLLQSAVGALVALIPVAVWVSVSNIERDLDRRVRAALDVAERVGLDVTFAGQDVTVSCWVPIDDPMALMALIEDVRGVREARLGTSCSSVPSGAVAAGPGAPDSEVRQPGGVMLVELEDQPPGPDAAPSIETDTDEHPGRSEDGVALELSLTVSADFRDGRLTLSGVVPDTIARDVLIAAAETAIAPKNIVDELVIDIDSAIGVDDVDAALAGLATLIASAPAELVSGTARLNRGDLSLTGVFTTDDQREALLAVAERTGASIAITDRPVATVSDATALADLLNRVVAEDPILFETAGAVLTEDAKGVLDRVAAVAERYAEIAIRVVGYTDSRGDAATNLELSRRRAEAVVEALLDRGVTAPLTSVGRGERAPVTVDGVEDVEASRRVEFVVRADTP